MATAHTQRPSVDSYLIGTHHVLALVARVSLVAILERRVGHSNG